MQPPPPPPRLPPHSPPPPPPPSQFDSNSPYYSQPPYYPHQPPYYNHHQNNHPYFQNPNYFPQRPNYFPIQQHDRPNYSDFSYFPPPTAASAPSSTTTPTRPQPQQPPPLTEARPNYFPIEQHDHPNYSDSSYFPQTTAASAPSATTTPTHPQPQPQPQPQQTPAVTAATPNVKLKKKATRKAERLLALPELETAVNRARLELTAAGERLVVWKVSQLALAKLHAESWDSFGFKISQIPILRCLIADEAQNVKYSHGAFVAIWKEVCQEYTPLEVFGKMLQLQQLKKARRKKMISIFSAYPLVGFLNIAVLSIKRGMWGTLYHTFQPMRELEANVIKSIRTFVTTWKEACKIHSAEQVLEGMMTLYQYKMDKKTKDKLRFVFSTYPLVEFLDIAVTSIKRGVWDSLCYTLEEPEHVNNQADDFTRSESADVEPVEKDSALHNEGASESVSCVDVKNIVRKALLYFDESVLLPDGSSHLDKVLMLVKQLRHCKVWLAEQFSVDEFESLGHGDFMSFLESNISTAPNELLKSVGGKELVHQSLEVRMIQHQLGMLLSQASSSLWEDDDVTEDKISKLIKRQFPFISFESFERGKMGGIKELLDITRQDRRNVTSNNLLYSAALLGTSDYANSIVVSENGASDNYGVNVNIDHRSGNLRSVTSRGTLEVLLKAPFLTDLNSWSHWDVAYAPSLGPLLEWLLSEANAKALTCLLTRDSKIIRIDHLASGDMFLEALIQQLPLQMAVQLLSVFALSGGMRHVPLSLLKCQARQGFEVIMANAMQNIDDGGHCERMSAEHETGGRGSNVYPVKNLKGVKNASRLISRIVIDCLAFLPSEFRCFAADVLISGSRPLCKDVASAVLLQCTRMDERLILHEVGLSLGIVEWINDHCSLCPITDKLSVVSIREPHLVSVSSDVKASDCTKGKSSDLHLSSAVRMLTNACSALDIPEVDDLENVMLPHLTKQGSEEHDAACVIESIRREEFGLDPNSEVESSLLKKQHARLGRALHCLSQGLYSQDAHFLLELVQNADDNLYPENVEPTLIFILQHTGIIVLNNERGFTADNMRALCDIGNSTKKGSSAGYIGEKGIGFKSVFRVTDAPEIHSNGFHVKFSISADQIGFVLPSIVPPCDIDMFTRLISEDDVRQCWKTCILLPFKPKLSKGSAASSILYMLSDLHPSLLLFLHRVRCIKLRNMLDESHIVMRKEILEDGIIKVSHGKEKTTWFVISKRLHPKINRSNVHITEISLALMLKETDNGDYEPCLCQQPIFAFLPLRTYGLKFILHADFVLPSSREEVDVDSPWNQWLLSEFPDLFVNAEKSLCSLPCFRDYPARAVSVYMSFVPLVGEAHGFFSGLPRMIISKIRHANCLLQDGCKDKWVPPSNVLRGWNEQVHMILPEILLYEHLGLVLLHKDVDLSDTLSNALGIEEYGPKILVQFMTSLARSKDGIKSMGLGWLVCWLNELHNMFLSYALNLKTASFEVDLVNILKKVPFIPMSDGTYASSDEGTIWLHDYVSTGIPGELRNEAFPRLYTEIRTISPALFTEAGDVALIINCTRMLQKIGVRLISGHELVKAHILPSVSDHRLTKDKQLMTDYITFVMVHLQSNCVDCHVESEHIISELRDKALILTNYGYKRFVDVPIHFSREFGNYVDVNKFINGLDYKWHELDKIYLQHSAMKFTSCGLTKWREFFLKLGVTEFVKIVVSEKSISDISSHQMMCDRRLFSPVLVVMDWESDELLHILSLLSICGSREKCKYLLAVLDALWDDYFSDKVFGCCSSITAPENFFKSSLVTSFTNIKWVVSSADNELHYPRDLFYDCYEVQSTLGCHASYAIPKIKSIKLSSEIGLKTEVMLDDALAMLQTWRTLKSPFTASLSQMSKFYTFIWKEMASSRQEVLDAFISGPFIFVPDASLILQEDSVAGVFLSPVELYWHDPTGALDQIQHAASRIVSKTKKKKSRTARKTLSKTLCSVYPGLHDFFVVECGVNEVPPFRHYVQILQQLSRNALPVEAAHVVFQVLLRWSEGIKCGGLHTDDITYLKECLSQLDFTVLPALGNKWVSSHPSFGLLCWCDDDDLKKEFDHLNDVVFLYFGELLEIEKEKLHSNVSVILTLLGIPSLSKIVSRKAICNGPADSSIMTSMVEWVIPCAQRYLYNLHPEKYNQLKQAGFSKIYELRVIVVEKLSYCNVIKKLDRASNKQSECSSLLQDNILYASQNADSHFVFLELSRLLFDGNPDIHLANFLYMITVMSEAGSTDEQIELFILDNQKMAELPDDECVWYLSSSLYLEGTNDHFLVRNFLSTDINEHIGSESMENPTVSTSISVGWREIHSDYTYNDGGGCGTDTEGDNLLNLPETSMKSVSNPTDVGVPFLVLQADFEAGPGESSRKNRVLKNKAGAQEAMQTGRQGELVAYRYFVEKAGAAMVNWVNQEKETGLPYDIVVGEEENREYIEVKASRYARKDWFGISTREWQFAAEKGDSFSVAHVILAGGNLAKLTVHKNPVKLCQKGKLQLAVMSQRLYKK